MCIKYLLERRLLQCCNTNTLLQQFLLHKSCSLKSCPPRTQTTARTRTQCCTELKASSILCGRQTNKCELLIYFYTMADETGNLVTPLYIMVHRKYRDKLFPSLLSGVKMLPVLPCCISTCQRCRRPD